MDHECGVEGIVFEGQGENAALAELDLSGQPGPFGERAGGGNELGCEINAVHRGAKVTRHMAGHPAYARTQIKDVAARVDARTAGNPRCGGGPANVKLVDTVQIGGREAVRIAPFGLDHPQQLFLNQATSIMGGN